MRHPNYIRLILLLSFLSTDTYAQKNQKRFESINKICEQIDSIRNYQMIEIFDPREIGFHNYEDIDAVISARFSGDTLLRIFELVRIRTVVINNTYYFKDGKLILTSQSQRLFNDDTLVLKMPMPESSFSALYYFNKNRLIHKTENRQRISLEKKWLVKDVLNLSSYYKRLLEDKKHKRRTA